MTSLAPVATCLRACGLCTLRLDSDALAELDPGMLIILLDHLLLKTNNELATEIINPSFTMVSCSGQVRTVVMDVLSDSRAGPPNQSLLRNLRTIHTICTNYTHGRAALLFCRPCPISGRLTFNLAAIDKVFQIRVTRGDDIRRAVRRLRPFDIANWARLTSRYLSLAKSIELRIESTFG